MKAFCIYKASVKPPCFCTAISNFSHLSLCKCLNPSFLSSFFAPILLYCLTPFLISSFCSNCFPKSSALPCPALPCPGRGLTPPGGLPWAPLPLRREVFFLDSRGSGLLRVVRSPPGHPADPLPALGRPGGSCGGWQLRRARRALPESLGLG